MKRLLFALGSGLLFGAGLCLSGMIDPRKVIGFLDVTGHWDPSLAAVMAGAVGVHAALLRVLGYRSAVNRAGRRRLDGALLAGSAIFGVGWGLAGYCPGPAIVSVGLGIGGALAFVTSMLVGGWLADRLAGRSATVDDSAADAPSCG